ncbi:hypothetical protein Dimus_017397 [Dionaea muscipula]
MISHLLITPLYYDGLTSTGSNATSLPAENVTVVPVIFVFGDSIVDPGNTNRIGSICKADYSPYGRDFQGGKATGRYSNGRIPSDFAGVVWCGSAEDRRGRGTTRRVFASIENNCRGLFKILR